MSINPITSVQLPSHILIDGPAPAESCADASFEGLEYDYQGIVDFDDRVRDLESFEKFQKEHPNLNIYGRLGFTPLSIATRKGCVPVIEALLDKDPSLVNKTFHHSRVPYVVSAACSGSVDAVKAFVKRGANINITNDRGETPLATASKNRNWKVTKYLLLHGGVLYQEPRKDMLTSISWAQSEKDKVAQQPEFINKVIKKIKEEYEGAHKGFERIVFPRTYTTDSSGKKVESEPQKTIFSKLPSHLIRQVLSFSSEIAPVKGISSEPFHLHKQFVEKVNAPCPTEEEVKLAASSPGKPA